MTSPRRSPTGSTTPGWPPRPSTPSGRSTAGSSPATKWQTASTERTSADCGLDSVRRLLVVDAGGLARVDVLGFLLTAHDEFAVRRLDVGVVGEATHRVGVFRVVEH